MITSLSGSGAYPYYHALWHLQSIGVMGPAGEAGDGWRAAAEHVGAGRPSVRETRVVLLDNSVAAAHPNLADAIDTERTIDFVSARLGAFPAHHDPETFAATGAASPAVPPEAENAARGIATSAGAACERLAEELIARLAPSADDAPASPHAPGHPALAATRAAFSAHGTAMAGLIGARPHADPARPPNVSGPLSDALRQALAPDRTVFPYAGVDPFCRIVPVSTSFDPDPEQYALALLYAVLVEADVIVLARDFPDPFRAPVSGGGEAAEELPRALLRAPPTNEEESLWSELERLLETISRRVPILCAAGNGSGERAIYPASLASERNGIVSVGAFTADGHVAGYSASGDAVDVLAPSGDGERLDRELQRLDALARSDDHPDPALDRFLPRDGGPASEGASTSADASARIRHCPQDLISTDVPGAFGYDRGHTPSSVADAAADDPASCFCRFGGTSGAVAVAAGFLSLMYSSGRLTRDGDEDRGLRAKRALIASGTGANAGTDAAGVDGPDGRAAKAIHWRDGAPEPGS